MIWKTPNYMIDMPPWTPEDLPPPEPKKPLRPECQGLPFPDAVMCDSNPEMWKIIKKFREIMEGGNGLATSVGGK